MTNTATNTNPGTAAGDQGKQPTGGANNNDGSGNPPPPAAYRPEGLADHLFGNSDKVTIDNLHKAYTGARDELAKGGNKAPKSAEEYVLNLADDIKGKVMLAGEDGKDPVFEAIKPVFHEAGVSVDGANKIVGALYKAVADKVAKDQEAAANDPNAPDWDFKKLGGKEKAQGLIDAGTAWIDGVSKKLGLDDADKQELQLLTTHSAGLNVLNKLRALTGEKAIPADLSGSGGNAVTQEDIDALRTDPKYLDGDESLHKQVRDLTTKKLRQEGKIK